MIELALLYKDELTTKLRKTWFKEKYKYYNYSSYFSDFELSTDNWVNQQFVSVDKDNNILGYISYNVNRQTNNAEELGIISFVDNSITFGKDLHQVILDIFLKFNYNKLSFTVVMGNPIEKYYNRMVLKYGGRIVGIKQQDARLMDNKIYDVKLYEITKDKFISSYNFMHKIGKS